MTVAQMHQAFRFGLDKMDNLNYPNFEPEEIDLLLNQAQERFVKQRYGITNIKRTSFEETQKRTEDLKELIRDITILPNAYTTTNINTKSLFYNLPGDHWFLIQERVVQTCDKCNEFPITIVTNIGNELNPEYVETVYQAKYAEVRPIQHVEFDKTIKDAFRAPDYDKVLRLMYDNQVEIVTSSKCTSIQYKMRYIKKPLSISLTGPTNCELSDHTHQEIVDEAIKIALEGIEAKRTQTFTPIIDNQKE